MLFDWLVVGEVLPMNPAASVRGPKYVTKGGELHEVPDHHNAEAYVDAYIAAAGIPPHLMSSMANHTFTVARC
jgi:hypothetical protein